MTSRTPNHKLRGLLAENVWTFAALAKAVRAVAAECGTRLRTNKSTVEHWIAGVTPAGDTGRYLAVALSRCLGRPSGTYARIVTPNLVASAEMQLKCGQIEQACTTWGRAMDHMDGIRSVRTRKAVTSMRRDLSASRFRTRGLRYAAELDERAIDFLSERR